MSWDALVAGAGPAGTVAAGVLAGAGRRVLLVDDVFPGRRKVGESLPGVARPLLRDLGLLKVVEEGPHLPSFGNVSAWGAGELGSTDFIYAPHGPGWQLDRGRFDADLRYMVQDAGVTLRAAHLRSVTADNDGWQVVLDDGRVGARWLVDATGRRAALARSLGVRRRRDDALVAICGWFEAGEGDMDSRTLVEATAYGWWYTALVPGRSRVVVLHVDAQDAAAILHTTQAWEEHLARTQHVGNLLAGSTLIDGPRGVEACGSRLDRFWGNNWLAAGDAALSFDPISAQGIFNALYSGMKAGQAVDAALDGDMAQLKAYGDRLEKVRATYQQRHRTLYQRERRWPDQSFWAQRQALPAIYG